MSYNFNKVTDMKNFLLKLFCIFAFILCFVSSSFAAGDISFSSVTYDNSASFLVLNSFDNELYSFDSKPVLHIDSDNNIVYFDIQNAVLNCPNKDMVIKSKEINEIIVAQYSLSPHIVRVKIFYNADFNPKNIALKLVGNSVFVEFKRPSMGNYYFQNIYTESKPSEIYETTEIQDKITAMHSDLLGQINSAFNALSSDESNFVLTKHNLYLPTKYYVNSILFKANMPIINGFGAYNISKPIYLSEPSRVAYDITNAVVNPAIRNKDFRIGDSGDIIKIGQYDRNTVRIVITASNPEKYLPVIYSDTQKLVFVNTKTSNLKTLYSSIVNLTSTKYEKVDDNIAGVKFVFNAPLVFGINRNSDNLTLSLYNVSGYSEADIVSELKNTSFEKIKISDIKNSGLSLKFQADAGDSFDIHIGSDGKTLRIRQHFSLHKVSEEVKLETPGIVVPVFQNREKGKKYVFIDAGHGGSDCGAIRNGINEKDITLDVAKRVEKILVKKGYIVEMTRTTDKTVSLQERVDMSELFNPDIFISIHVNSNNNESPNGVETHYYKDNSLLLAKCVHAALLNNVSAHDRGLFKSKFYVINHTTAPAILVEMGFLSNPSERAKLMTESRRAATAKAIVEGIDGYFKQ